MFRESTCSEFQFKTVQVWKSSGKSFTSSSDVTNYREQLLLMCSGRVRATNVNSRLFKFGNPLVSLIWNFTRRSNVTNYRERLLLTCLGKVCAMNFNSRLFKSGNPPVSLIRNLQHGLVSQDSSWVAMT